MSDWIWCEWESLELFNEWHETIKKELNYPITPINQGTGELDTSFQSSEYTEVFEVEDKFIAMVESQFIENLQTTELRTKGKKIETNSL